MINYDMEVQCFKMWDKVRYEKLQNGSSFVNHLKFGNLSLIIYCSFIPVKVYTCLTPSLRLLDCLLNDNLFAMILFFFIQNPSKTLNAIKPIQNPIASIDKFS